MNYREGWRCYLWQGRFASYPMDENYLPAAARYVELNPVRAKLAARPEEYPWSSAGAHLQGMDAPLVKGQPLLDLIDDWGRFPSLGQAEEESAALRRHSGTGRPLGTESFVRTLETTLNRVLRRQKPGPRKKS